MTTKRALKIAPGEWVMLPGFDEPSEVFVAVTFDGKTNLHFVKDPSVTVLPSDYMTIVPKPVEY